MPRGYRTYYTPKPQNRSRSENQSQSQFVNRSQFEVVESDSQPYVPSQPSYNRHVRSNRCRFYGIVKVYFLDRGYGFIRGDDGQEYFFKTRNGFVLKSGMKVGFEIEGSDNGQRAVRVTYNGKQMN